MKKIILVISALVIMVITATFLGLTSKESAGVAGMVDLCSSINKERMKSPSSYNLLSATVLQSIPSEREKINKALGHSDSDKILSGELPLKTFNIFISYESANSYNALLKSDGFCSFELLGDDAYELMKVRIGDAILSGDTEINDASLLRDKNIGENTFSNRFKYLNMKYLKGLLVNEGQNQIDFEKD